MATLPTNIPLLSDSVRDQLRDMIIAQLEAASPDSGLSLQDKKDLAANLSSLTEEQIVALGHKESVCPICFTTLLALLAEEEMAIAMDSPAHPAEELGVTRLAQPWQCGHIFCRRDISRWIWDGHATCPMCRRPLLKSEEGSNATSAEAPLAEPIELPMDQAQLESIFQGILVDIPSSTTNRSEYSGMYS